MTIYAAPGATIEASALLAETGLVGTLRVRILDTPAGAAFLAPTTVGIVENPAASKLYTWSGTGPTTAGTLSIIWDRGSDATVLAVEELVVTSSGIIAASPTGSDLCTVADVKTLIGSTAAGIDAKIQALITQGSDVVMRRYQRQWAPTETAASHTFPVEGSLVDFAPYDLRAATSVTLNPEAASELRILVATTEYALVFPRIRDAVWLGMRVSQGVPLSSTYSWAFGRGQVTILGNWGCLAVPLAITRAMAQTVAAWIDRPAAAYGWGDSGVVGDSSPTAEPTWDVPMAAHRIFSAESRQASF